VNHDMRIALAKLQESQAILRDQRWQALPSVTAEAAATRQKASADVSPPSQPLISEHVQAGLLTSWELDLFGRTKNQIQLARAQLNVSEADVHATQISLAAQVASVYINLRGLQQQLDIAQKSVAIQKRQENLVQKRKEVGLASNLEVDQIATQLTLTEAQIPYLQQQWQTSIQRLSVLTVFPPNELEQRLNSQPATTALPTSVAVGNASDWLKRRPDVLAADYALQGALAEYNIHVADLYPRLTLIGQFGYLSTEWSQLGRESSETFNFSPVLHWAALDLTRVKARIAASDARAQASLAKFEQTVAIALEETQNAFTRFTQEELRNQHLKNALTTSTRAADFANNTYQIGSGQLEQVLDAELIRLQTAQQFANSETQRLLNLMDIYKNLGGGWAFEAPTT
jgi:outer membrane protein, multidrug efflux system